jgi:hypothetical protein
MDVAELHTTTLRHTIDSRDVIGQAKGVLMTWQGLDAETHAPLRGGPRRGRRYQYAGLRLRR